MFVHNIEAFYDFSARSESVTNSIFQSINNAECVVINAFATFRIIKYSSSLAILLHTYWRIFVSFLFFLQKKFLRKYNLNFYDLWLIHFQTKLDITSVSRYDHIKCAAHSGFAYVCMHVCLYTDGAHFASSAVANLYQPA